jgi:hypothetical protein
MRTCEIRDGRLVVNDEVLPIRQPIVQAGLAIYGQRTGRYLGPRRGSRPIPAEAADEILALERRSSLALLAISLEDAYDVA